MPEVEDGAQPEVSPEQFEKFDFSTTEVYEDDEAPPAAAEPAEESPEPSAGLEDVQSQIAELHKAKEELEQRLADNKAHSDRLFQENQAASKLLAEYIGGQDAAKEAREKVKFEAPEAPSADQLIQDPLQAVKYAEEYARRTAKHTRETLLADMQPFLQATAAMNPLVNGMVNHGQLTAIEKARATIDEAEHEAFDAAISEIATALKNSPNGTGAVLSLNPQSWIKGYRMVGGTAAPVRAKSPRPQTVQPSRQPASESGRSSEKIPPHMVQWAKQAGRDPKEFYARHQARTGGKR